MTDFHDVWTSPLTLDEVPEEGLHVDLAADEPVRMALARSAQLRALDRLSASFDVTRTGRNGLHIIGEVSSNVVQDCVVTLEPVEQTLVEPIDLTFVPASAQGATTTEIETSLQSGESDTEPLTGGMVDLGAIATEYFLLGIDPYPRKPGASFEAPGTAEPAANPFAGLADLLKSKPDGK